MATQAASGLLVAGLSPSALARIGPLLLVKTGPLEERRLARAKSRASQYEVICAEARAHEVRVLAIPRNCNGLERAGRVKGGAAAERSEGTLDATEHSNRLTTRGIGWSTFHEQTRVNSPER